MVPSGPQKLMSQMRRGAIEYCVLALLESRDRYGLEITKALNDADELVTSEGTIYPLLTRLRNDELVDTYIEESPEGPPRRYYRLTPAGHTALGIFRQQWARFRDSVDDVLKEGRP